MFLNSILNSRMFHYKLSSIGGRLRSNGAQATKLFHKKIFWNFLKS